MTDIKFEATFLGILYQKFIFLCLASHIMPQNYIFN